MDYISHTASTGVFDHAHAPKPFRDGRRRRTNSALSPVFCLVGGTKKVPRKPGEKEPNFPDVAKNNCSVEAFVKGNLSQVWI